MGFSDGLLGKQTTLANIGTINIVMILLLLSGCGHTGSRMSRFEQTNLEPGGALTIVLSSYEKCDADASPPCHVLPPSDVEKKFEGCLSGSIHDERPELTIISVAEFHKAVFPNNGRDMIPRSIEAYLPLVKEPEFQQYVNRSKLNYIIFVHVNSSNLSSKWGPYGDISSGLWLIGNQWSTNSSMTADILNVHKYLQSGAVSSWSRGKAGIGFPVLYVIPLPIPIPLFAMPETDACQSMGKAIVQFIEGKNF
jgi:hypothetical protein